MNLLKIISVFFALAFLTFCSMQEQEQKKQERSASQKLQDFLSQHGKSSDSIASVLLLTEDGCPACNRYYSKIVQQHLSNENALCIISAKGRKLDISPYLNSETAVLDINKKFMQLGVADSSCSIFLTPTGEIDTIVTIHAKSIRRDLDYIIERLQQHQ